MHAHRHLLDERLRGSSMFERPIRCSRGSIHYSRLPKGPAVWRDMGSRGVYAGIMKGCDEPPYLPVAPAFPAQPGYGSIDAQLLAYHDHQDLIYILTWRPCALLPHSQPQPAPEMTWEITVQQKIAERQTRLPTKWLVPEADLPDDDTLDVSKLCLEKSWLTPTELQITKLIVTQLAQAIADRKFTSVQVVEAFAHRATIAQQLINP